MFKKRKNYFNYVAGPLVMPSLIGLKDDDDLKNYFKSSPIFKNVYSLGVSEGKKEGLIEAANVFEEKFKSQIESFLDKEENLATDIQELERLLLDAEDYIKLLLAGIEKEKNNQVRFEKSIRLNFKSDE